MQQRRAWICVGRIWCCLQSHQVSVTMSLARQNHCLCLQLVASLSFPGPRQALVALLGIQQSLCVHSSDQAGIRPLALALAVHWQPLWRGQLNLHSRSQPPTLGGHREISDSLPDHTDGEGGQGSNLYPFSAQLHHAIMLILSRSGFSPHDGEEASLWGRHSEEF